MSNQNLRPKPDELLVTLADYVYDKKITCDTAFDTAEIALLDSLGCAILGLQEPKCHALIGPYVKGTVVPKGSRVPGTNFALDPIKAAFDIGACIRWLDYNDTWLAKEWGHPSDNLGAILAVSDYFGQLQSSPDNSYYPDKIITLETVLEAMIKAYEIQGILALENSFNALGFDHVFLVKIASTAVAAKLMSLSKDQAVDALSQAFADGASLRAYRHAPNTGPRKSWAAGDACRRAVELCWLTRHGQPGMPAILSTKRWGFNDAVFQGKDLKLGRALDSYVMEHILFKVSYPAEFHAQTAVEAAIKLHQQHKQLYTLDKENLDSGNLIDSIDSIEKIVIKTQESAMRIINKIGPLYNYADRDHSLQYMVAIALLFGELKSEHYSDAFSKDERIDKLRDKMIIEEERGFSKEYLDPEKRSISNAVQLFFTDGSQSDEIAIHYPLGHRNRRAEALPFLKEKYRKAIQSYYKGEQAEKLCSLWGNLKNARAMPISAFMSQWMSMDLEGSHFL